MKLKLLMEGEKHSIYSPVYKECFTYFEEFINQLSPNYERSLNGIFTLMKQHVNNGSDVFNTKQCHYVDQKERIYEYIKGDLRIFWFHDEDRVVICFHGIIKKSQKTPKKEIRKAIDLKAQYIHGKESNQIQYIED